MKSKLSLIVVLIVSLVVTSCGLLNPGKDVPLVDDAIYESINYLEIAPFIYSLDEAGYEADRAEAMGELMTLLSTTSQMALKTSDDISSYQEALLGYMDDLSEAGEHELAEEMIGHLFEYQLIMEASKRQMMAFDSKLSSDKGLEALRDTYRMGAISDMVVVEKSYVAYLLQVTAILATIIDETENALDMSGLEVAFESLTLKYEEVAYRVALIATTDYHHGEALYQALEEDMKGLWDQYEAGDLNVEASYLEELEETLTYLMDNHEPPENLILANQQSGFIQLSQGQSRTEPIESSVVKMSSGFKGQAKGTLDESFQETLQKQKEAIKESNKTLQEQALPGSAPSVVGQSKDAMAFEKMVRVQKDHGFLTKYVIGSKLESLKKVKGTDARYDAIISLLVKSIKNFGTNVNDQTTADFKKKLEEDFVEMLGDNKELFVQKIVDSTVVDFLDLYESWSLSTDKFDLTKFDVGNLAALADYMGIELEGINKVVKDVSDASIAEDASTSISTDLANTDLDPLTEEDYLEGDKDHTHITASYEEILALSENLSNDAFMMALFGWEDPVDYSQYAKDEKEDPNGRVTRSYLTSEGLAIGWEEAELIDMVKYTYHFPEAGMGLIEIIRIGSLQSSYISRIYATDIDYGREAQFAFDFEANKANAKVKYAYAKQEGSFDGIRVLQTGIYMKEEHYEVGDLVIEKKYENTMLINEVYYTYENGDTYKQEKIYNKQNGQLMDNKHMKNDVLDGLWDHYSDQGILIETSSYADGIYHGEQLVYSESGSGLVIELSNYFNGKKEGEHIKTYDNGQVAVKGQYYNDLETGEWLTYNEEGVLQSQINYEEGLYHGYYASHKTTSDNTGQGEFNKVVGTYSKGKKQGEFTTYYKEKIINITYYENDIRKWAKVGDETIYYD